MREACIMRMKADRRPEAYMNDDEKELAIKNYEKSLELSPKNSNVADMLKKSRQ